MEPKTPTALSIYIRAVLPEREDYLREQAMRNARSIVRGMSAKQAQEYYESAAFKSLLYRTQRRDKAYQALLRGELALDRHLAEFERLRPLIERATARGGEADVAFLRSVLNSRVSLEDPEPVLEEIQKRKSLLSEGIIHVLSTQRLQQKTCAECGRPLAWNWPHRLCDDCHRRGSFGRRKRGTK